MLLTIQALTQLTAFEMSVSVLAVTEETNCDWIFWKAKEKMVISTKEFIERKPCSLYGQVIGDKQRDQRSKSLGSQVFDMHLIHQSWKRVLPTSLTNTEWCSEGEAELGCERIHTSNSAVFSYLLCTMWKKNQVRRLLHKQVDLLNTALTDSKWLKEGKEVSRAAFRTVECHGWGTEHPGLVHICDPQKKGSDSFHYSLHWPFSLRNILVNSVCCFLGKNLRPGYLIFYICEKCNIEI